MSERCHICDRVKAEDTDDEHSGDHARGLLCWSEFGADELCQMIGNWRARALAAEAALERLKGIAELLDTQPNWPPMPREHVATAIRAAMETT